MTTTTKTIGGGTLTVSPKTEPYNEQQNYSAFAVIKSDGSVFAWGDKNSGGDMSSVASQLDGTIPVTQIFSNNQSFAALRLDGSVVTWGNKDYGGDSSTVSYLLNGDIDVTQIYSDGGAFAALRSDGSVVTWGSSDYSGDSSSVSVQINGSIPVTKIYSVGWSFFALRADGSVVAWGGAEIDNAVADYLNGDIDVTEIYANWIGCAAVIRADGSVISWGTAESNYDETTKVYTPIPIDSYMVSNQLSSGVKQIYPISSAFIALKTDGSIFTWGAKEIVDISSSVADQLNGSIDVKEIYSSSRAYAALRADGSVISWGWTGYDTTTMLPDYVNSDSILRELNGDNPVKKIYSTSYMNGSFAALREDGSVFTWGDASFGGDSSSVANELNGSIDVKEIYSSSGAYAALRADGSVVTWGYNNSGGDSNLVARELNGKIDVTKIYTNDFSFAALRSDGSVVTWGIIDSSAVANNLNGDIDVKEIYSNGRGFAALRKDGSVITWGLNAGYDENLGDVIPLDTKVLSDQLTDVVSFANPATDDVYISPTKEIHINHTPTGSIRITGTPTQAQILTVKNMLVDEDGLGDLSYQWLSNGKEIVGATSDSYVLSAADVGKKISVQASYLDGEGTEEFVTSKATAAIASNISKKATNGNDEITGTAKTEKLDSLAGNDLLKGLAGNDTLIGGAGFDTLIGGAGADNLTGGSEGDIFKFIALSDSGITSKTRDTITDFRSGADKIDLSAIDANEKLAGDQAFTFIGSSAFSKTNASGQLRFDSTSKILYASTDADSSPEFSIQLSGVKSLVSGDFIL